MGSSDEARFWAKVDKTGHCWIWQAAPSSSGYGTFKVHGRTEQAHRFAYELLVDQIPFGLTIDHICRVRMCVNPDHMEVVTLRENLMRGNSPSSVHARKETCPNGHLYNRTDPNSGARLCQPCRTEYMRSYRTRNVAAAS